MFNLSSEIILGCKLSLAKLLSEFIIFLVHCQSVNTEKSTVNGVEGNPAVFQWTVNQSRFHLGSLLIFHGARFDSARVLFSLDMSKQILHPSMLATSSFEGHLNAAISGDVEKDSQFNCTLTLDDLQLSDRDQDFYLYASFVGAGDEGKVITLVNVQGIYWFLSFFISVVFYHERHDVRPFK